MLAILFTFLWSCEDQSAYWIRFAKGPRRNGEGLQVRNEDANSQSAGNMDFDYLNLISLYFYQARSIRQRP